MEYCDPRGRNKKNKDEYPHAQASAHPPTYTPLTSFFCSWITHSGAVKISYPDMDGGKQADIVFSEIKRVSSMEIER